MPRRETAFFTHNRYDQKSGCWNWTGSTARHGYGIKVYLGKKITVHRLSMHIYKGFDLKSKLCVLHRCDNAKCFNPNHLFLGTQKENIHDCIAKGRFKLNLA